MNAIENVSRRSFLKGMVATGALVLSARYYPELVWAQGLPKDTQADLATLHPNVFVGIDTDGTVYIVAHRSEMGTGIRTSLPLVVADELDADWKRVKIDQPGDIEAIMADYAEDAVLITPDGVLKGQAQIRSLFAQIFANTFPPDKTSLNLSKQVVEGEIAYNLWSGSSPHYNAPLAADTFVMRDGKIVAQPLQPSRKGNKPATAS
jgi:hypothetical protein